MREVDMRRSRILAAVAVLVLVLGGAVAAQEEKQSHVLTPGGIDLGVSGGLGGLIYPYLQPSIDVGVAALDQVTFSAGATLDAGICAFCGLIGATTDWQVRSWYASAIGRAHVHVSGLSEAVSDTLRLDPYAGLGVGPRFYSFSVTYEPTDDSASATQTSVLFGPILGSRILFEERSLYVFGELRYFFEFGFSSVDVETSGASYSVDDQFAGGGGDISFGIGFRL
jgi:hypothetical protein